MMSLQDPSQITTFDPVARRYFSSDQVRYVELEITTLCNAACPQCPRNHHGGPTIASLPLVSWTLTDLQKALDPELVRQLEAVYLCGTYGDPMINRHVVDICQWLRDINPALEIGLHTNGAVGRADSYVRLASIVDFVAFGIDGLEDTNHLYRRNTTWSVLMRNVKAFVKAGGRAYWDFIVFHHNQHQVDQARSRSQQLGFARFNVKKTYRFFNRQHQYTSGLQVLGPKLQPEYMLLPPTDARYLNDGMTQWANIDFEQYRRDVKISCYFLEHNRIYIGADGNVFPCGWLHDRLYGIESEASPDHKEIKRMMAESGHHNVWHTPLRDIIDGPWFRAIQDQWQTRRLERCVVMCGKKVSIIDDQNHDVKY
jgi:MoaA/NifB/PqqE/SkfB family radical SAM enzyme